MKKFRIVAMLLVLVLATSCFAAGTFAKYTSTAYSSDYAVVAKWSINLADDGVDNNGADYDIATGNVSFELFKASKVYELTGYTTGAPDDDADVDTGASSAIIAPGTWGYVDITLTNASEVTLRYGIDFAFDTGNNADIPLQYAIVKDQGATVTLPGDAAWSASNDTLGERLNKIDVDPALDATSDIPTLYTAQTHSADNTKANTVTYRIFWKWTIDDNTVNADPNKSDTALGKLSAAGVTVPTVEIKATYKAMQVD